MACTLYRLATSRAEIQIFGGLASYALSERVNSVYAQHVLKRLCQFLSFKAYVEHTVKFMHAHFTHKFQRHTTRAYACIRISYLMHCTYT
jgi:hypothetical protein